MQNLDFEHTNDAPYLMLGDVYILFGENQVSNDWYQIQGD